MFVGQVFMSRSKTEISTHELRRSGASAKRRKVLDREVGGALPRRRYGRSVSLNLPPMILPSRFWQGQIGIPDFGCQIHA